MTRKKASLKGKGHSILLGDEKAPSSPPQPLSESERSPEAHGNGNDASVEPVPGQEETMDWAAMLEDEAAAAEPPEEEVTMPSLPAIEYYYSKESPADQEKGPEPLAVDEPVVAEPSPAPGGAVAPPTPVAAGFEVSPEANEGSPPATHLQEDQEVDWAPMLEDEVATAESPAEEMAVPPIEHYYPPEEPVLPESGLPPAKETAVSPPPPKAVAGSGPPLPSAATSQPPLAVTTSPPRLRVGGLLAGVSLEEELPPPGPGFRELKVRETTKAPTRELTNDEEEIVIGRVTKRQRRELYGLITQLYSNVPTKLAASGLKAKQQEAFLLLSEARDIVLEDPRQFDEAEHKVWQVQAIIANAEDVVKWSHHYGNRLIAYLTTWFVLLMAGILFFNPLAVWLEGITSATPLGILPIAVPPLLFTMLWGGIGGIIGGFYSLWQHIAEEQDFDKQYTVWYTLQPISGVVLGGIIHVIVLTGFLSMFSQVPGADATAARESQAVQWFPALLAVVAGFRPNFVYALLSQIIKLVGHTSEQES